MSSPTTSQQCDLRIQYLTMPIRCPHFGKSVLDTADQLHQRLCTNGVGIRCSLRRQRRRAVCCGRHDGSAWPSVAAEPEIWLHCFLCSAQAHRAHSQVRPQLVLHHGAACRASVSSVVRIKVLLALISCRSWQILAALGPASILHIDGRRRLLCWVCRAGHTSVALAGLLEQVVSTEPLASCDLKSASPALLWHEEVAPLATVCWHSWHSIIENHAPTHGFGQNDRKERIGTKQVSPAKVVQELQTPQWRAKVAAA